MRDSHEPNAALQVTDTPIATLMLGSLSAELRPFV
jgi:hypothetical protein